MSLFRERELRLFGDRLKALTLGDGTRLLDSQRFNKDAELLDDLNVRLWSGPHFSFYLKLVQHPYMLRRRSSNSIHPAPQDHWTAKTHKAERNWLILEARKLAVEKRFRVTFLSGDVHLAAVGRVFDKRGYPPERDPAYMLNIISSAIVNTPPPMASA